MDSLEQKEHTGLLLFAHIISAVIALISAITRSHEILVYLQAMLIIAIIIVHILQSLQKHKKFLSQTRVIYLLILVFWLLNLGVVTPGRMFVSLEVQLTTQIISTGLFLFIYYKVHKLIS